MRLISWNVNGIRAVHRRDDLRWLWDEGDVICVQETKANIEQIPEDLVSPEGFTAFWESGEKKGYSGVAVFVREGIFVKERARGLGDERFDNEGRVLILDFDAFTLLNIYFPNGGRGPERVQYKLDFYERFFEVVQSIRDEGREVVVCGDVNTAHRDIDIHNPSAKPSTGFLPEERAFLDRFLASGFIDTFRAEHGDRPGVYTWWDVRRDAREVNEGWRIDYFYLSEGLEDCLADAWVNANISGSDHCPIGLELELE